MAAGASAGASGVSAGVVSTGGFGLRFGAAGSVGTSCFGLFLLPGGLPRRFGSGAPAQRVAQPLAPPLAPLAPPPLVRSVPFNYTWSRYNTNDRTTLPSRSVRRKRMCLRVTGPLRAMKCPSSKPRRSSALSWTGCRPPDCPARGWRWPAGRSAGRPRCAPSSGRIRRSAARRRRSSGTACGPR